MSVRLQDRNVLIDDVPTVLFSGEIQYYRLHPGEWQDRLEKLRAMGLNSVGTYICWNYHSPSKGVVDFTTPARDVGRFLDLAEAAGLVTIVRPGPYVCNEWDLGGYPGWLMEEPSGDWRTGDEAHLKYCLPWFEAVDRIFAPRQHGRGGSVALYQVENEHWWGYPELFDGLADQAQRDGIEVPLISNCGGGLYESGSTRIADGSDAYTAKYATDFFRSFSKHLLRVMPPDHPLIVPEYRASYMPLWGDPAPTEENLPSDWVVTFARGLLGAGANVTNYFVAAGGVTPVGYGSDHISTCYGADAAVAPWGGLGRKFYLTRLLSEAVASVSQQLSLAKPCNDTKNSDNDSVDCLTRIGERGTFIFPVNMSDETQEFAVMLADGERIPATGTLSIPSRESMFLMAHVDLGEGVSLDSCTAEVMKVWTEGDVVRAVVMGDQGLRGEAAFTAGDASCRIEFTCSDAVNLHRGGLGGKRVELYAITRERAERTWFVECQGRTLPVFSTLDLVRTGRDEDGRVHAESDPTGETRIIMDARSIEVDGVALDRAERDDGLAEFTIPPARNIALDITYGTARARLESDSWTTEDVSAGGGWRQVNPFDGSDIITDTGTYQYRTQFDVKGELPSTLEFTALSSAEMVAYLNGKRIGSFPERRPNAYHALTSLAARFDVSGTIKAGTNELALAFTVVGRHNNGRPITAGMTRPPILYRERDEEVVRQWHESPVGDRRCLEHELYAVPEEARAMPVPETWPMLDLSQEREVARPSSAQWLHVRWYRARIEIPERMRSRPLFLQCPHVDQMWVFVEGECAGMARTDQSKIFDLRPWSQKEEIDVAIAVRGSWKSTLYLNGAPRLVAADDVIETNWSKREGFEGTRGNWKTYADGWRETLDTQGARVAWYRSAVDVKRPEGLSAPLYVELDDAWRTHATIFWNGDPIGQYASIGPDRRFYIPDALVLAQNDLMISVDGFSESAQFGSVTLGAYELRARHRLLIK